MHKSDSLAMHAYVTNRQTLGDANPNWALMIGHKGPSRTMYPNASAVHQSTINSIELDINKDLICLMMRAPSFDDF